jgi:hypothetical protein
MSRAVDETGAVQPTRAAMIGARGANYRYHPRFRAGTSRPRGEIGNVYV